MEIALWIVSGLLALANLFAGTMKLVRPKEALVSRMAWAGDFSPLQIKAIGALEIAGALGLILPRLTEILPWLSVVAAFALALLQLVALSVHVRRKETFVPNLVLVALALFVGVGLLLV